MRIKCISRALYHLLRPFTDCQREKG